MGEAEAVEEAGLLDEEPDVGDVAPLEVDRKNKTDVLERAGIIWNIGEEAIVVVLFCAEMVNCQRPGTAEFGMFNSNWLAAAGEFP